ncbi:MAG TPA: hypothetical protein VG498_17810 [Terriglobales bacterium]|nr:hypothetical protein [Terriglobales bacterium]
MRRIARINHEPDVETEINSGRGDLPQVHEKKRSLQFAIEELEYQPEPDTLAGFIVDVSQRVDELLAAAKWQRQLD